MVEHHGAVDGAVAARRDFLKKAGIGAAAAWAAPVLLSNAAGAQGTPPPPVTPTFVTSAQAYSQTATILDYVRSITLTTGSGLNPLQAGDLWLAVVSYDTREVFNSLPGGPGWQVTGPIDQVAANANYGVRSYLIARQIVSSDLVGGVFTPPAITTGSDPIDRGGLRGAAVVYRGTSTGTPLALPAVTTNQATTNSNNITATYPAAAATPATPNMVVRIGAARGYGGCNATNNNIDWTGGPGTNRVDYNSGNEGDRALWISEQADNAAATTTGTWYRQATAVLCTPQGNWITFTAVVLGV